MAARYARAAGGNWSADATWSTTDGGAADTVAPTAADDVFLTATSGQVTIAAASACRSINCTGYTNTLTHNAFTFSIGDATAGASNIALKFVAGMTYTKVGTTTTSDFNFISTSATVQSVDFAGKTTSQVQFNGSTGSWQYTGAHTTNTGAAVYLTRGTLDINGQTCSWGFFDTNNSNTRVLTLGAANITITGTGGSGIQWNASSSGTGLTVTANTANITLSGAAAGSFWGSKTWGGTISFTGSGAPGFSSGGGSFNNVTRTGTAVKTDSFVFAGDITVTGTFTCNGNSAINRVLVYSSTVGTARTITAATWVVTNTDFQDITGAGAGSRDFSAQTDVGDCGGNSGITFPASVSQYYGGVNLNGSYLRYNGIVSNYVSAPDSAALSITGDIELQARVSLDDWTPASLQNALIGKWVSGINKRGYALVVTPATGTLTFFLSSDGSTSQSAVSSVATGFTDGTPHWIKCTYVKSTGIVQFFTADDSGAVPSSWTQLGTDISTITADSAIFDHDQPLEVGSIGLGTSSLSFGKHYRARVLNGVGGTVVFDADFASQAAGTKSFTESSAQGATVSLIITGGNHSASAWTTRVPLPQDDAYLGNAFLASQTVTADMPRLGRSIDWTGATGTPTWNCSVVCASYGNLTLISGMVNTATSILTLSGRGSFSITSNGSSNSPRLSIGVTTASNYTMVDAFSYTGTTNINFNAGTLTANGNFTSSASFSMAFGAGLARTLNMGNGTWTFITTAGTFWSNTATSSLVTVNPGTSSIVWNTATASTLTFAGGSCTYGTLTYTVAGSTGELDITGSNSFAQINFSDVTNARSLKFTNSTITTIRNGNGFNVRGTSGKLMTINTISGASTFTLTSPNQQSIDYANIIRSTVDATPKWYAGANSTDGTGNTNWLFIAAPSLGLGQNAYHISKTRGTAFSNHSSVTYASERKPTHASTIRNQ